jgi:hypothetical protein
MQYKQSANGEWAPVADNDGMPVTLQTALNGELPQFNRLAGGAVAAYSNKTATGVVSAVPSIVYGYIVTTAMSAAATTVYDNAAAASGTVLFVIPASTAVGFYSLPVGMIAVNGIYASFAGTGTVNFLHVPEV